MIKRSKLKGLGFKPVYPAVLVLLLGFTVLSACAEPPDKIEHGGAGAETPVGGVENVEGGGSETEYREGYLLTVDGNAIAYIEDADTV